MWWLAAAGEGQRMIWCLARGEKATRAWPETGPEERVDSHNLQGVLSFH